MGGFASVPGLQTAMQPPDIQQAASGGAQQTANILQQNQQQPQQAPPQQQQPQGQQGQDPFAESENYYRQQIASNTPSPSSGGPIRKMLQNFIGGMGQSLMHEGGLPTP